MLSFLKYKRRIFFSLFIFGYLSIYLFPSAVATVSVNSFWVANDRNYAILRGQDYYSTYLTGPLLAFVNLSADFNISSSNLVLQTPTQNFKFNNCMKQGNYYVCQLAFAQELSKGVNTFVVKYLSNDNRVLASKSAYVCYNISSLEINPALKVEEGKVTVDLNLQEKSSNSNCPCVGISGVEIRLGNKIVATKSLATSYNTCTAQTSLSFVVTGEGNNQLHLLGILNNGNKYSSSTTFYVDTEPPKVESIEVVNKDLHPVNTISFSPYTSASVAIKFVINDKNFDTLIVDLSNAFDNSFLKKNYASLKFTKDKCIAHQGKYVCVTPLIKPDKASFKVLYSVCDNYENCKYGDKSFSLKVDSSGPELVMWDSYTDLNAQILLPREKQKQSDINNLNALVNMGDNSWSVYKKYVHNCGTKCYIRPNSKLVFKVKFHDDTGMTKNNVIFDIDDLSTQYKYVIPNYFNSTGNSEYAATLIIPKVDDVHDSNNNFKQSLTLKLTSHTKDVVGNPFSGFSLSYVLDDSSPQILNFSVFRGNRESYGNFTIATGDNVNLKIIANDTCEKLFYLFDFSDLTINPSYVSGECLKQNSSFICSAMSKPVKPGPFDGKIKVYIYDLAGNVKKSEIPVHILGKRDAKPNIVFYEPSYSPSFLDRKLITQINFPMRIEFDFASQGYTIDRQFISCRPPEDYVENGENTQGFFDSYFLSTSVGSTSSILFIMFNIINPNYANNHDYINFTCKLTTYARYKGYIYSVPDITEFNISIPLKDFALGNPGEQVVKQIETDLNSWYIQYGGVLNVVKNIVRIGGFVCSLRKSYTIVDVSVAQAGGVTSGIMALLDTVKYAFPPAKPYVEPVENFIKPFKDGLKSMYDMLNGFLENMFGSAKIDASGNLLGFVNNGTLDKICSWITCDKCKKQDVQNLVNRLWGAKSSYMMGVDLSGEQIDPKDSIVGSFLCGCLPSFLANLNKIRELTCERDLCLFERASAGATLMPCWQDYSDKMCNLAIGEFWWFSGYFGVVDKMITDLGSAVQLDENFLKKLIFGFICPSSIGDWSKGFDWKKAGSYLNLPSILSATPNNPGQNPFGNFGDFLYWLVCRLPKAYVQAQAAIEQIKSGFESWGDLFNNIISGKWDKVISISSDLFGLPQQVVDAFQWKKDACDVLYDVTYGLENQSNNNLNPTINQTTE